jgi:glutathione synthase/RimK-type ligase-like ATP-grasp enzyme
LANALGIKRLRPVGQSKFVARHTDVIINWGRYTPFVPAGHILNLPGAVMAARNKLTAYTVMRESGVCVPEFTTDPAVARSWLWSDHPVLSRYTLTGQAGAGIVYYGGKADYDRFLHDSRAPLYVKYVPKKSEYRVHVIDEHAVDVQQKRTRSGTTGNCHKIRNAANGWVFCRENVEVYEDVISQAVSAVRALGLDFGAVDVGWTEKHRVATVYEVNTAPGLEGTTLERYTEGLKSLINQ